MLINMLLMMRHYGRQEFLIWLDTKYKSDTKSQLVLLLLSLAGALLLPLYLLLFVAIIIITFDMLFLVFGRQALSHL